MRKQAADIEVKATLAGSKNSSTVAIKPQFRPENTIPFYYEFG